jgi:rhodanese-related sulfurtransferase
MDHEAAIAARKVTLLDGNGTESWQKGNIPGAIDFEAQSGKLAKLLPKDKNALVVAYCGGPKCQAYEAAAKAAEKLGYTNIKHLTAGISGWQEARETIQKADEGLLNAAPRSPKRKPAPQRSAGFQPAVSRISNPQTRPNRYCLPAGSRRYGRLETSCVRHES